jgi:hypothetical protein
MELMNVTGLIVTLIVMILLFLALREVNCWYWKINKKIELQEKTNELLQKLIDQNQKKEVNPNKLIESTEQTSLNDPEVLNELINKLNKKG